MPRTMTITTTTTCGLCPANKGQLKDGEYMTVIFIKEARLHENDFCLEHGAKVVEGGEPSKANFIEIQKAANDELKEWWRGLTPEEQKAVRKESWDSSKQGAIPKDVREAFIEQAGVTEAVATEPGI